MTRGIIPAALAAILLLATGAQAQVVPSGVFTPGHPLTSVLPDGSAIVDGGGAAGATIPGLGYLTEIGITNTGTPFCINDTLINDPSGYHQFCLGANALGGGLISYNNYGGASALPLDFVINGATYPFPGPGNGNVMGPSPSVMGSIPVFNNTVGTLLADSQTYNGTATILRSPDTSWSPFGTPALVVTKGGGQGAIVGFAVGDTPGSLPAGTVGYGKVTTPNANAFGVYGLGELSPGASQPGQAVAAEFTCRNNSANPAASIVCNSLQVTAGGAFPSGDGIAIGLEGGSPITTTSFLNAIFIKGDYGTAAMDIEAPSTGNQYGILLKNNGTGTPLHMIVTGAATPNNSVMDAVDASNNQISSIRQNGDIYTAGRLEFIPASRPSVSSCGTSPSVNRSNNQSGTITVGSGGVTSCTVTFSVDFQQIPSCTVTPEGGSPGLLIGTKSKHLLTINSVAAADMSGTNFDYHCFDQP